MTNLKSLAELKTLDVPLPSSDPSDASGSRVCFAHTEDSLNANADDQNIQTTTSVGITKLKDGREIGWLNHREDSSYYNPDTSNTTAVDMNENSPFMKEYDIVEGRYVDKPDPLASS